MSGINEFLEQLLGKQVPGGCDQCDAEQRMVKPGPDPVYICEILHDDDCPVLLREKRGNPGIVDP